MTSDCASNEILATQAGAGQRDPNLEEGGVGEQNDGILTPNLKMVGRDKAHSFRRLMTRPVKVDGYLSDIIEDFISSKSSMAQKIQASYDLKDIFRQEIAADLEHNTADSPVTARIQNLRAAKHRFESLASPLGRMLLYLPSFIKACQRVSETRKGQAVARSARLFLDQLSAERLLQAALLSDGLDEALLLVRQVDCQDVDVADVPGQVQSFVDRLHCLFGPDRAALTAPTYTKHVVELLQQGKVAFVVDDGDVRRLAMPSSPSTLDRVFKRMQLWMNLVMQVLKSEWPDYTLFAAMGVFNLVDGSCRSAAARRFKVDVDVSCQRLAKVFEVSASGFEAELDRLRPLASRRLGFCI